MISDSFKATPCGGGAVADWLPSCRTQFAATPARSWGMAEAEAARAATSFVPFQSNLLIECWLWGRGGRGRGHSGVTVGSVEPRCRFMRHHGGLTSPPKFLLLLLHFQLSLRRLLRNFNSFHYNLIPFFFFQISILIIKSCTFAAICKWGGTEWEGE